MASIITLKPPKLSIHNHQRTNLASSLSSFRFNSTALKPAKNAKVNGGSSSTVLACSTSPFIGRVGFHRREGNSSMLSFGLNPDSASDVANNDSSQALSALLPFVVAATAVVALAQPSTFTWVSKELYAPALGGIMLSIGIKLSIDDFALAFKRPLPLSIGFLAQYAIKPAIGVLIAKAFGMSRLFYAGSVVPVDAVAMSKSILQVVLFPITLGLVLNTYAKPVVRFLQPVMPVVAMICTSLCIGSPLAINRSQILSREGLQLVLPVLTFHAVAFAAGHWVSKIPSLRQGEEVSRTISLCTGMQSSTLAGLLAAQFLGSTQAVPPACSVITMAIMGLCLASFWGSGYRIRDLPYLLTSRIGSIVNAQ
ncbi:hypothetical protein Q3G72_011011 [Acer saccharum]|nr:hypothetical protein Q3G72_011011 [Acer saccharum]